jgi:hypothetical protein
MNGKNTYRPRSIDLLREAHLDKGVSDSHLFYVKNSLQEIQTYVQAIYDGEGTVKYYKADKKVLLIDDVPAWYIEKRFDDKDGITGKVIVTSWANTEMIESYTSTLKEAFAQHYGEIKVYNESLPGLSPGHACIVIRDSSGVASIRAMDTLLAVADDFFARLAKGGAEPVMVNGMLLAGLPHELRPTLVRSIW